MVIKVKYNGEWVKIPYLSSDHGRELVEEAPKDGSQYARQNGVWSVVNIPEVDFTEVYNAIDTKVDKVEGKGLSTNDYITADKTKVTNINEVIEAAAKNITATGISITLDKRNLVTNVVENIELNLPASTTALAGLMLPADKIKLNGIAAGAEVNVNADWNATEGDAQILNKPTLATVATSGSYNDLTSKPTIPTVDVNKEYVDTQLATKSDLPDYTVFDIVMEITSSDNPSISQENYNKLLEKLPSNAVNTLPVRDNGMYISSLLGGYNVNGDNAIWFHLEASAGVLQDYSIQISIYQDLTVSIDSGSKYLLPTSNGIDIFTDLTHNLSESNTKKLTIYTTGDGTKALMDDGTYKSMPTLEDQYAYGVEWDTASSSPDGVRVGNMQLHRELPIQSKMKIREVTDKGGVIAPSTTGMVQNLNGSIMTEIPEHWYKLYTNGTKFKMMLSEIPLPGYKHVDTFYISTYEACIRRDTNTLWSENLYKYVDESSLSNFRGGDNTSDWDGTYRSLLRMPVTNLTRDQFRQAARKRGSGWEMYTYGAHKTLFWLFAVEYATLNSQKPFNAQKDANGFAQGGLGPGPTQMTDWTNFNNANPLIPCGYTNEFGNGSGEKAYVVKNASGGTHATLMANRYRGIENPFGHIWKYTDGANIQVTTGDTGLSILWTTDDPSNFSDTSYTGYDKKGNICRTNGYVKRVLLGEDGDIVVTEVGGSSSTHWCDYYYTYTSINRMLMVRVGGDADRVLDAGFTCVAANIAPSDVSRNSSSRLCFFPKYKSTEITTTTE
jgi:hypothetical protein